MTLFADDHAATDDCIGVLNLQLGTASAAMTPAMAHAGIEALSTTLRDPDIHVIVLTGSAQQFCLGLQESSPELHAAHDEPAFIDALHDWLLALCDNDKPIIAAVEGQASGAGLALALACDLIVCARSAQFLLPMAGEINGRHAGASWLAAKRLPRAALAELYLPDGGMSAERAHTLGLVCRLAEPGMALPMALQLARPLARHTLEELGCIKQHMAHVGSQPLHEALADERRRWLRHRALAPAHGRS